MDTELDSEVQRDVQSIRAELVRLSRLVNNLLTNARAEVGVLPQVFADKAQPVELDALVIEVARQARYLSHVAIGAASSRTIRYTRKKQKYQEQCIASLPYMAFSTNGKQNI